MCVCVCVLNFSIFPLKKTTTRPCRGPRVFGAASPWGARVQSKMINFMTGCTTGTPVTPFHASQQHFPSNGAPCSVPRQTLARWLEHYLWWGETPAQTRALVLDSRYSATVVLQYSIVL